MKAQCIAAVAQAIGRNITKAEADGIETRIMRFMRLLQRRDPKAWSALGPQDRLNAAAEEAGKELVFEAQLAKRRVILNVQAFDRIQRVVQGFRTTQAGVKAGVMAGLDALDRTLSFKADQQSPIQSSTSRFMAVRADALRQLQETFLSVSPKFFGFFENAEGVQNLTRAIFGQKTGIAEIDAGAKAWLDVAGQLRDLFNAAGGKIGQLRNWALPQHHSVLRMIKVTADDWAGTVLPLLDRTQYLDDAGRPLDDASLLKLLRDVYVTITSGGADPAAPAGGGAMMIANRNAAHRELFFKDADGYLEYQAKFGERDLWSVMTGHVDRLAKEIALLEQYGPNPEATFAAHVQREGAEARIAASQLPNARARAKALNKIAAAEKTLVKKFSFFLNGAEIVNPQIARAFSEVRNVMVWRLGSSAITAITDEATIQLTARVNGLPFMQLLRNQFAAFNPANRTEKALAHRAGLALDAMVEELNRWGHESLGKSATSTIASHTLRVSGMNALDGARRRAFGTTMLSALGEVVEKYADLGKVSASDGRILRGKGVTDLDWSVWKAAQLEDWGRGNRVLTPDAINAIDAATMDRLAAPERARLTAEKAQKIADIQQAVTSGILDPQAGQASIADWTRVYDEQINGAADRMRREAVVRLLGLALEELDMAVIRPGLDDRYVTGGRFERGTYTGELTRSIFVFKSFPIAMIRRHWGRAMAMPDGTGRAAYIAALVAGTTILGAVAQTINDLLSGKDIRNYDPTSKNGVKNGIAAMLKGGSLGIYGDFLFSGTTQSGRTTPVGALMGPVVGLAEEAIGLTQGNLVQLAQGNETNFGAEATRLAKSFNPLSSLWYTKAAMDHLIFHNLQEYFSPGYLQKMRRRSERDFGIGYWWAPGFNLDMRMPKVGN